MHLNDSPSTGLGARKTAYRLKRAAPSLRTILQSLLMNTSIGMLIIIINGATKKTVGEVPDGGKIMAET